MSKPVYCLDCSSDHCEHMQPPPANFLTPREASIIRAMGNPHPATLKEIAFSLGLSDGTMRVYVAQLYKKLGWSGGNTRLLSLWAIAHREQFNIPLPTPDQFAQRA